MWEERRGNSFTVPTGYGDHGQPALTGYAYDWRDDYWRLRPRNTTPKHLITQACNAKRKLAVSIARWVMNDYAKA